MKKMVLALAAATAFTGQAIAADMRAAYKAAPPPPPPCAQFGGFYVGAVGGGTAYQHGWQDVDAFRGQVGDDHQAADSVNGDKYGYNAGVTAGWNYQSQCTLFGLEGDWSWNRSKANSRITLAGHNPINLRATEISSDMRWFATFRSRSGIIVNNVLLYVTGGLAVADFSRRYAFTDDGDTLVTEVLSGSQTRWGWTAGVGTEWAFAPNWSLKSDVLYMSFQKSDLALRSTVFDPGVSYRFSNQDNVWVSRIGVNYRFGGPVVGRY